ncbi:MAG: dihydroorotate dehydrogenase electron transfer subunit [candidate division Zixibacteria bacterium]
MRKIIPQVCRVVSNRKLNSSGAYFKIAVEGFKLSKRILPGQFVHVKVDPGNDPYFRRAFSVADFDKATGRLDIIYKIVGKGTSILGNMRKGDSLDLIGPLGNHFNKPGKNKNLVMVAGGVGLPPLLFYCRYLLNSGYPSKNIMFLYGGRTNNELVELASLRRLGVEFIPCTDDGSYGFHGLITEALKAKLPELDTNKTMLFGCGPEPMLEALQNLAIQHGYKGQLSLEAPMPCGIGVCLGCIKERLDRPKKYVRVCYDGPVFNIGEVKI